ncbi:Gfo/Idh/MocA family protein [Streptomyces sp. NPDC058525]|uniref:Gfo/Idh/MocA family protein n=1 Tax=Streptomyces sp. NPDC058525 TaxID=3346538 RepID=UPI003667337B
MSVRLGVVGVGLMGEEHLKALALVPQVAVTAVTDPVPGRARSVAQRYGIGRVLDDPGALVGSADVDAVLIAVPPNVLTEIVPLVCTHRKPVLCEKPLGVTADEARSFLTAANEAGIVHALCHQRRYDPVHRYVRDLVGQGFVGVPRVVTVQVMTDFGRGPTGAGREWTRRRESGGGLLLQVVSHYLDLLHFTFGDVESTFCHATAAPAADGEASVGDGDDTVLFAGTLPGGGIVSLAAGWALEHPTGVTWQIHGAEGTVQITPTMRILGARRGMQIRDLGLPDAYLPPVGAELSSAYGRRGNFGWGDNTPMMASMVAEFAASIAGNLRTPPLYATFADGVWVLEAIERGDFRSLH